MNLSVLHTIYDVTTDSGDPGNGKKKKKPIIKLYAANNVYNNSRFSFSDQNNVVTFKKPNESYS